MGRVNKDSYIERITSSNSAGNKWKGKPFNNATWRNWWLVKAKDNKGCIVIHQVYFPSEYIGKRIRFKVEIVGGRDETIRTKIKN